MNKPIVKVKNVTYLVTQISVVLKLNSEPLIYLRLSDKLDSTGNKSSIKETLKQEFLPHIFQEEECSFQWQGITLKFFLVGCHNIEATTFELVGLVVSKDLIDWFKTNNFKVNNQDYLIYQKLAAKNVWPFFNQVLGEKFAKPNEEFVQKINFLFPENSCIWRHKNSDNLDFLNKALTFASRYLPEVQGWCAFDDANKPLRLILFEKEKQDLTIPKIDQTWTPLSYPFLPNRYSWNQLSDSSCNLSRELSLTTGQEIALIKQLVSDGSNGENDQKGQNFQAQNPTRLLFAPGTVTIGNKNIFCHTVTYEFKLPAFGEEPPSVTMKVELNYPHETRDNEILPLRLLGGFQKWYTTIDGETVVKITPSNTNSWGVLDEKSQTLKSGNKAVLSTQILSPTHSNNQHSGIYVKHEKNDEMIVDIKPCSIPLALGSVQKYRQQLEEASITLCGQKLAISVSPHNQKLANAEAIILDNAEIKLNHGKTISGQAQQSVDFLSKSIELGSSKIKINSAQTKINSSVNISFPTPRLPKPNLTVAPAGTPVDPRRSAAKRQRTAVSEEPSAKRQRTVVPSSSSSKAPPPAVPSSSSNTASSRGGGRPSDISTKLARARFNRNGKNKTRGINFQKWKKGYEAQHIIPYAVAKKLNLPMNEINNEWNGMMLPSGRKGAASPIWKPNGKYKQRPNHIKKGWDHPHYSKNVEDFIKKVQGQQKIDNTKMKKIAEYLRTETKKQTKVGAIDDMVLPTNPPKF